MKLVIVFALLVALSMAVDYSLADTVIPNRAIIKDTIDMKAMAKEITPDNILLRHKRDNCEDGEVDCTQHCRDKGYTSGFCSSKSCICMK